MRISKDAINRISLYEESKKIPEDLSICWDFLYKEDDLQGVFIYPFWRFLELIFNCFISELSSIKNSFNEDLVRKLIARDIIIIVTRLVQRPIIWEYTIVKRNSENHLTFLEFISIMSKPNQIVIFFKKYMVLYDIFINMINNYIDFLKEFLQRLRTDYSEIKYFLLKDDLVLAGFEIKGDPHCFGRRTMRVYFKSPEGTHSIMYKPRPMDLEKSFQNYVGLINKLNKYATDLLSAKIINKKTYGWEEFFEHKGLDCEDIGKFYFRLGFTLGMIYSLNGHDFHYENLIAHGEYPQFIDFECLFSIPTNAKQSKNGDWPTIFDTSIIPRIKKTGVPHYDFSALLFHNKQVSPNMRIMIQGIGSDSPFAVREKPYISPEKNYVYIGNNKNKISPVKYVDDIINGYERYSTILIENKEIILKFIIKNFNNVKNRVIFKSTFIYDKIMNESYHPELLSNNALYLKHLQQIKNENSGNKKMFIIQNEVSDLLQGDIPYFTYYTDEKLLNSSSGDNIPYGFHKTGIERVINKINCYSFNKIKYQKSLIRKSIKDNYGQ